VGVRPTEPGRGNQAPHAATWCRWRADAERHDEFVQRRLLLRTHECAAEAEDGAFLRCLRHLARGVDDPLTERRYLGGRLRRHDGDAGEADTTAERPLMSAIVHPGCRLNY
jgi:hypothetical protein